MSEVVDRTEQYYDSKDADEFYFRIWGGEDIHIGTYLSPQDSIFDASRRTVEWLAGMIKHLPAGSEVLDIGAGYGGAARYLAEQQDLRVYCLNLSKVQNDRNRQLNEKQGLADKIDVVDGNFESLPYADASMDAAWSQDAILHSGNRLQVFSEVCRVLKPGGDFIFTDPMQRADASKEDLQPVLDRIHLADLGSVEVYREYAAELGLQFIGYEDRTDQLVNHYSAVHQNLDSRTAELVTDISEEYIENMKRGLRHWINAGKAGLLAWGALHFRKAAT